MTIIKLNVVRVYGKKLIYPLNYQTELAVLTCKQTLDMNDIKALKGLGITFEVVGGNDLQQLQEMVGVA